MHSPYVVVHEQNLPVAGLTCNPWKELTGQ